MSQQRKFIPVYEPAFFLHKVNNYEKAIYQRKGHWTQKEKIKYGVFLQIFRDKFQDRENPILNKMFRVMSDFIKTRNHNQCRSHHQKMERERFQIDSILESIKSKYHPRQYEIFYEKYSKHIKAVNVDVVLNQKGFTPHKNIQKRRKIKISGPQAKCENQEIIMRKTHEELKIKKIQNLDQTNKVLQQYEEEIQESNKRSIYISKENGIQLSKSSKIEQDKIDQPFTHKVISMNEKPNEDKNENKRTGLEYDSDQEYDDNPKVAHVQIPVHHELPQNKFKMNFNNEPGNGMPSGLFNPMGNIPLGSQMNIPSFQSYPTLSDQFPPPRMNPNPFPFEQNYSISVKDLQERKKWHLSQASRLCMQMNQHLQRANTCDQMKDLMMKQIMDSRRGFFYANGFPNSQY